MDIKRLAFGLAAALAALTFCGAASAAVSATDNMICATTDVVACTDASCLQGDAKAFDLPLFMFIDLKRKLVHGKDENNAEISSPIKNMETTDNALILQGFENHRGWTLAIDRKTGELNMSSTGAQVNFIISGNCTNR